MQTGKVLAGVMSVLLTVVALLIPPLYAASGVSPEGVVGDAWLPEASQADEAPSYAATGVDPNASKASESTPQTEQAETTPQVETPSGAVERSGALRGRATAAAQPTAPTSADTGLPSQ